MSSEKELAQSKEAMTPSNLSDASKQHTHVKKDDGFADLLVNKSHSLHVRFSRQNLINAVTFTMLRAVLERLLEEDADAPTSRSILQRQNVKPASDSTFTVTEFAERLLYDGDRRADIYLERLLRERDLATALQALGRASARLLSRGVLEGQVQQIGEGILDDLEDAKSLGSHLVTLRQIVEELNYSIGAINTRRETCSSQRTILQTRLNADANAAQHQPATESKWWQPLQQQLSNIQQRFSHPKSSSNASTATRRALAVEKQLLNTELRLRALDAELSVLVSLVTLLNREITVDEAAIDTLHTEFQITANTAQEFEGFRDYSVAGGEMLLNDAALTEAVMDYVFGNNDADIASQITILSGRCRDLIANAQGIVTPAVVREMQQIAREVVTELLKGLTITDALAALQRSDENFQDKLREAFRMTASMDFLAIGYENFLEPQRFVSVSYALSSLPRANSETKSMLLKMFNTLQLDANTLHDITDEECLRFSIEYFSLPLKALRFFEVSSKEFEASKNNSRFNIHPHLHS